MPTIRLQTNRNTSVRQTPKSFFGLSALTVIKGLFLACLCRLRDMKPWTMLAVLFAMHFFGAFLLKGYLSFRHPERLVPFFVLALGCGFCLWASRHDLRVNGSAFMRAVPVGLYAFFIVAMSHQPFKGVSLPVSGNAFHPILYACFALFWGWFRLPSLQTRSLLRFGLGILIPGTLFALSDEWHQSWVPGRSCSLLDVILDVIGLCIGSAGILALLRWAPLWHPSRLKKPV